MLNYNFKEYIGEDFEAAFFEIYTKNISEAIIEYKNKKTLILNLAKREDEVLSDMHQKTRYNIRLAAKKGVMVKEAQEKDFIAWWQLMEETKTRDKFRLHSRVIIKKC